MLIESVIKTSGSSIRLSDGTVAAETDVRIEQEWHGDRLKARVVNTSNQPLRIQEAVLFAGELALKPETPFYGEGFMMLCQYEGTLASPQLLGAYGTDWDFFRLPRTRFNEHLWTVYNLIQLSPEHQDPILLAFTSCNRFVGEFRFKDNYMEIVMDTEGLALEPMQSWELESFIAISSPDLHTLYERLAGDIQSNHPRKTYPEIPSGWCSYYCLRPMNALGLYENARGIAERIPELKRIQIDGGYEAHNGDWLIPRASLGADMKTICEGIRAEGVEAAGYISPFIVSTESNLFKEHPDWLVRDEEGNPFNEIGRKREWYMLDGTHPEVQNYLRHISRVMHDEWGIRYFKLDFLAYGCLPGGVRYDPKATRVEAFRQGMKAIVDEVGHDSFILGCNAPFWPILGLIHGNRVTNDIFRDWKHVSNNARELFYRNWQHDTLWYNDPDVIVLESLDLTGRKNGEVVIKKSTLTEQEFEFHKAFIAASGGMILSGDLLYQLSESNIRVLKKLIADTGQAARFDDTTFTVGRIQQEDRLTLCLFNWEDEGKEMRAALEGTYRVSDYWTDEELGEFSGELRIRMEPHGGRVLVCKPA
ncbi:glycoside hydrolase family 36 protein [Paenibacillus sp. OAS669]|uniref:glycoside hydrolase family 36 protein n=1 Tax=Paenibacillus sp. OAS669 TaxID=2663821 RepID=UPI00178AD406|nr:glycoside hydrolase family 36 protein [Paenibacillus sp. OAS669]MBE1441431.1 alpha-galactosidase [Paenibacillus sp. OAS669]